MQVVVAVESLASNAAPCVQTGAHEQAATPAAPLVL